MDHNIKIKIGVNSLDDILSTKLIDSRLKFLSFRIGDDFEWLSLHFDKFMIDQEVPPEDAYFYMDDSTNICNGKEFIMNKTCSESELSKLLAKIQNIESLEGFVLRYDPAWEAFIEEVGGKSPYNNPYFESEKIDCMGLYKKITVNNIVVSIDKVVPLKSTNHLSVKCDNTSTTIMIKDFIDEFTTYGMWDFKD